MPLPKFNFVPLKQAEDTGDIGLSVSISGVGQMRFRKEDVRIYGLEGIFIQLLVDKEKKAIAWKKFKGSPSQEALRELNLKQLVSNPKSGGMVISVRKAMNSIGIPPKTKFKNIPVREYEGSYLTEPVQYITLLDDYIVKKGKREE